MYTFVYIHVHIVALHSVQRAMSTQMDIPCVCKLIYYIYT